MRLDIPEKLRLVLADYRYTLEREPGQGGMATVYRFAREIEVVARAVRIAEIESVALHLRP